jgi:ParB family transcriptional regulator, chromosome partitioning protein
MAPKTRSSVEPVMSPSTDETEKTLLEAQEKINTLEEELANVQGKLREQIGQQQISQALVPIAEILRRPYKSRREKDPQKFTELVHSIQTYGFRGSIWLQKQFTGETRLIAGETRLDAAIAAGYTEIPADIVEVDDITAAKLSRVENARRKDLNALDDTEELLYLLMLTLKKERSETIECLYRYKNASEGKSTIENEEKTAIETVFVEVAPDISPFTFIASRLPLLKLPEDVLTAYNASQLEYTKAMVLGRIQDDVLRQKLLNEVIQAGLSLAALKAKIKPMSGRTVIDRVVKVHQQINGLDTKSMAKLSVDQRTQLKDSLLELKTSLQKKLKELDQF